MRDEDDNGWKSLLRKENSYLFKSFDSKNTSDDSTSRAIDLMKRETEALRMQLNSLRQQMIAEASEQRAEDKKTSEEFNKTIATQTANLDAIKKDIEVAKVELRKENNSVTEMLGVFVALFTFVSVSFQLVHDELSPKRTAAILFALLSALITFLIFQQLFIVVRYERALRWEYIALLFFLTLFAGFCIWKSASMFT